VSFDELAMIGRISVETEGYKAVRRGVALIVQCVLLSGGKGVIVGVTLLSSLVNELRWGVEMRGTSLVVNLVSA